MMQILLLGDSLVAENDWQSRMPSYRVYNFGTPGIMTSDLFQDVPEIKNQVPTADIVMVMVGTNDLLSGNFEFVHALKKLFILLNHHYPMAEIISNSLFPMYLPHLPDNTIENFNKHIKLISMQTGTFFLNTYNRFINADKHMFQDDGVHLTRAAYEIWTRALLEHIAFLVDDD
jgi:lysophospholipase L1-like esterase